jgi:hypothetical protein
MDRDQQQGIFLAVHLTANGQRCILGHHHTSSSKPLITQENIYWNLMALKITNIFINSRSYIFCKAGTEFLSIMRCEISTPRWGKRHTKIIRYMMNFMSLSLILLAEETEGHMINTELPWRNTIVVFTIKHFVLLELQCSVTCMNFSI